MDNRTPLGTGFGARTTAAEVLEGTDLSGRTALVTGGYSGLGLAAAQALAAAGARLIVPARRPDAARAALEGLGAEVLPLDLGDLASVRACADALQGERIDIALLSAGIMACPETRLGPDEWEAQFATNHYGHFAMIAGLWPALTDGARVVAVSSGAHGITGIRWDDVHFRDGYDKWTAYGQSKCANVLFAVELSRRAAGRGIVAVSLNPGAILTPLQRHLTRDEMVAAGWVHEDGSLADPTFKTPEQGAATLVWAATSPLLEGRGGAYCDDCDIAPLAAAPGAPGVAPHAVDPEAAERLWEMSVRDTGVSPG